MRHRHRDDTALFVADLMFVEVCSRRLRCTSSPPGRALRFGCGWDDPAVQEWEPDSDGLAPTRESQSSAGGVPEACTAVRA